MSYCEIVPPEDMKQLLWIVSYTVSDLTIKKEDNMRLSIRYFLVFADTPGFFDLACDDSSKVSGKMRDYAEELLQLAQLTDILTSDGWELSVDCVSVEFYTNGTIATLNKAISKIKKLGIDTDE